MMRSAGLRLMLAAVLLMLSPVRGLAARAWMQDTELHAELVGHQLGGIYPGKVPWRELIAEDGTSNYEERGKRHPGRWTIGGGMFCFTYPPPTLGGCFRVVRHSANCYELYTASVGGHMPKAPPAASSLSWNGRLWREAERQTCQDKEIS